MANITIGGTLTVTKTEVQEPNIIDVDLWNAYRVINGVTEGLPIDTLTEGDGITIAEPTGNEGERTYAISWTHIVEEDVNVSDTYQILFVPGGTEADQSGILDWSSGEYDVVASISSSDQKQSLNLTVSMTL
jgi:hypothetical protein